MGHDDATALARAVDWLLCPVCGLELGLGNGDSRGTIHCENGHSFDIARQGYVSFLTGHGGGSTADTSDMVAARARFLGSGSFDPIADAVVATATDVGSGSGRELSGLAVEIGGGTGFYLARMLDSNEQLLGIDLDLSPRALRLAARAHPRMAAIAADAWSPFPLADASATLVLSVFSPRNPPEMARVLAPGGRLVIVSPTPRHLAELVDGLGLVTVDDRKPERLGRQFADFAPGPVVPIEYELDLAPETVRDVIMMGPSARHIDTGRLSAGRLTAHGLRTLPAQTTVTVSVEVRTYSAVEASR